MAGKDPEDPASRYDTGFVAADASLAIRYLMLALRALRRGDDEAFEKSLTKAEEQAGGLWTKYKEFLGEQQS